MLPLRVSVPLESSTLPGPLIEPAKALGTVLVCSRPSLGEVSTMAPLPVSVAPPCTFNVGVDNWPLTVKVLLVVAVTLAALRLPVIFSVPAFRTAAPAVVLVPLRVKLPLPALTKVSASRSGPFAAPRRTWCCSTGSRLTWWPRAWNYR